MVFAQVVGLSGDLDSHLSRASKVGLSGNTKTIAVLITSRSHIQNFGSLHYLHYLLIIDFVQVCMFNVKSFM